eukprot:TRINITY_DN33632_c0_g1_i1.p1 TRINITY_DN33632_c0_g1~~TRINITY_DN33632_c0_g1_i1.p1  ORF type:complete len:294 (+),score=53.40 TRINITY_DN33632_c0_g1_i1:116-883(+)
MIEFVSHSSLEKLDMTSKQLTGADVERILAAVKTPESLTTLVLANNPSVKADGGAAVGAFIEKATGLRELDLRSTNVGGVGLVRILDALKESSVTSLDFRRNSFNEHCARRVADFIEKSTSMVKMDVRHNPLHSGITFIIKAVENSGFTADILVDSVSSKFSAALNAALQANKKMVLTLSWSLSTGGTLDFVCTTLGGQEVASIEVQTSDNFGDIEAGIAHQLGVDVCNLVLILESVPVMDNTTRNASLQKLLGL